MCLARNRPAFATKPMTSHELFAAMPASLAADIIDFNHTADKRIYRAALDAVAQVRASARCFSNASRAANATPC
jgi:hypothetical protein